MIGKSERASASERPPRVRGAAFPWMFLSFRYKSGTTRKKLVFLCFLADSGVIAMLCRDKADNNNNNNSLSMFVPQMAAQIVLVVGVLCRRRRRWAGRQSILLYYTAHRDRRILKESASRGAVAEMQAQQPRRREHVPVDQNTFR